MSDTTNEKPDAIWYTGNDGKIYTSKVIGTAYGNANADRIAAAHNATVAALTAANARIGKLRAAIIPVDAAAAQKSPFWETDWNPEAHVEITLTIAECRALRAALNP